MQTSLPHLIRLTVVFAVIGLAVVGCGRKGDLDPPSADGNEGRRRIEADETAGRRRQAIPSRSFALIGTVP